MTALTTHHQSTTVDLRDRPHALHTAWLDFLPPEARRHVQVPSWATECHAEGWLAPDGHLTSVINDGTRTASFFWERTLPGRFPSFRPDYSLDQAQDTRVTIMRWDDLTSSPGSWGRVVYTYLRRPLKIVIRVGDADEVELPLDSAQALMVALGDAIGIAQR